MKIQERKNTSEEFTQVRFSLVQGSLSIFITDAHLGPISHKILSRRTKLYLWDTTSPSLVPQISTRGSTDLSHFVLSPETGIMQRCVSMFVGCISICFALDQLERNRNKGLHASHNSCSGFVEDVYRERCLRMEICHACGYMFEKYLAASWLRVDLECNIFFIILATCSYK